MEKIQLKLRNCYGIEDLEYSFDFSQGSVIAVYAPNGVMKTSLAKTFMDHCLGNKSIDLVYPIRETTREIIDVRAGVELPGSQVLVVEPYKEDYTSQKASLLLLERSIKKKYDDALNAVEGAASELMKKLKVRSGLTGRTVTPLS